MENQATKSLDPITSPAQTQIPPAKSNPWIMAGIGGMISAVGIVIGIVMMSRFLPPQTQVTPTPSPSITPTPILDLTANWKTYINNKNLYSVKIPPEWEPDKGNPGGEYTDEELQELDRMFWRKNNSMFSIQVLEDCTSLDKCFKEYQTSADNRAGTFGGRYTTIAFKTTPGSYQGIPSIEARSTYGESVNAVRGIFFVHKNKLWLLETESLPSLKEAGQILSTFKFLDQLSNPSNKTYTSPEVVEYYSPYTISYPSDWILTEKKLTGPDGLIVTLTSKNGSDLMIGQYAGDGGRCLYTTDADYSTYQGAGKQFSSYSQLNVPSPVKWRLSIPILADKFTYTVCEAASTYIDTTRIGSIQINLKSGDNVNDIQKILESVQFKPTDKTKTLFN